MRTEVQIFFHAEDIPGGAEAVLGSAGIGLDAALVRDYTIQQKSESPVWVTLDDTDERVPRLLELLTSYGESWLEYRRDRYTDDELDAARLLVVVPQREFTVFGGPRMGTSYDMSNACPKCGAGARQTSALIIDGEELPTLEGRRAASTPYSDIIVDERMAEELEGLGITGLSLRGVYAAMEDKRQIKLRWRQICAGKTLPPFSTHTAGIERKKECDACRRSGFFPMYWLTSRIAYRAEDLEGAGDINTTWEWFSESKFNGNVEEALFPYPYILVTPKVMHVFRDAGVTEFDWLPIRVVDEA